MAKQNGHRIPVHLEALECFLNGLHVFAHQFKSKRVQNLLRALLLDVRN